MSEGRARPDTEAEDRAPARRAQADGETATDGGDRPDQREPDVLLDVENLEVEKIALKVDDLRAHISVQAELANLVNLSVGADVQLGRVELEIEGVRAQALLKVRLENVRAILEKALQTLVEHPEILQNIGSGLGGALEGQGGEQEEGSGEVPATRAARRKAEQLGVELSGMQGSGPEGLITLRDVQDASRQG